MQEHCGSVLDAELGAVPHSTLQGGVRQTRGARLHQGARQGTEQTGERVRESDSAIQGRFRASCIFWEVGIKYLPPQVLVG